MVVRLLGIALTVAVVLAGTPAFAGTPSVQGLYDALEELDGAIEAIEWLAPSRHKTKALHRANEARRRIVAEIHAIEKADTGPEGHERRPHAEPQAIRPAAPEPMDAGRFDALAKRLRELSFSRDQLSYLQDAVRHQRFTTDQVRTVMKVFSFDADKVKAAVAMYPAVLDKADFYRAQDELTFEADRERLRAEVRRLDAAGLPPAREAR